MKRDEKQLMFVISKSLTEVEAESFARSLDSQTKWYLGKVLDDPKSYRKDRRERFVVCRDVRKNEVVDDAYGEYFKRNELKRVN